jgi:outer membrane protein TolC
MRSLRFTSIATLSTVFLAAPLALGQAPPPAPAAPAPAPAAAAEPAKSASLQRLEERLHALGQGRGLTADEVARRSVNSSATLEARRRGVEAAAAGVSQARSGYYPRVTLSASYTRLSDIDPPSFGSGGTLVATPAAPGTLNPTPTVAAPPLAFPVVLDNYALSAKLQVPISDYFLRVANSVASASRSHDAARLEVEAARRTRERDARVAYYQWIRAQAQELIAVQALEQANGHSSDTQNAFQAGLVSKADVLRVDAQVKNAELFQERAKNAVELAAVSLSVLMGDEPGRKYEVGEDVFAPAPELDRLPTPANAYTEAVARRSELKALERAEAALREQAAVARAGNYPRLDAQATALYANPNPRYFPQEEKFRATWEAGVVLSFTPTDIPGAQAQASIAEARALELAAQRRALHDALRLDVNRVIRAAEEARFAIGVSRNAADAAEEGYRVRRELYRAGRATTVEVTDAETELTRARIELVDAHVGARVALAELRHALGRDTGAGGAARAR